MAKWASRRALHTVVSKLSNSLGFAIFLKKKISIKSVQTNLDVEIKNDRCIYDFPEYIDFIHISVRLIVRLGGNSGDLEICFALLVSSFVSSFPITCK